MNINLKTFREKYPMPHFLSCHVSDYLCLALSPYITIYCIRHKIIPNTVTLFMILSGVFAGVVLILPFVWCKLTSFILYVLWFTFDCSDGEVARYTLKFSKGGKYLDWCAHLACHPLFVIGTFVSIIQFYNLNYIILSIVSASLVASDMIYRVQTAILTIIPELNNQATNGAPQYKRKPIHKYLVSQFTWFPNIVVFMPLLLFIDIYFELDYFVCIYIIIALIYIIMKLKDFIFFTYKLYII